MNNNNDNKNKNNNINNNNVFVYHSTCKSLKGNLHDLSSLRALIPASSGVIFIQYHLYSYIVKMFFMF